MTPPISPLSGRELESVYVRFPWLKGHHACGGCSRRLRSSFPCGSSPTRTYGHRDACRSSSTTSWRRSASTSARLREAPVIGDDEEPLAFQVFDPVGLRIVFTRLYRFTLVTARASLCLRLTHVVTSMSPRLDSQWSGSSPCRDGNCTRWKRRAWPG